MKTHLKDEAVERRFAKPSAAGRTVTKETEPLDSKITAILTERRGFFLGYLHARLGNRDEAEDVLQDFHLRVLLKAGQIRDEDSTLPWLRTVLKSVLADYCRREAAERHRRKSMAADLLATFSQEAISAADDEVFDHAACICFYRLLPTLKTEYADALYRMDIVGQLQADAAKALGISTGNMRVRLHRARGALKAKLESSYGQCRKNNCSWRCGRPEA